MRSQLVRSSQPGGMNGVNGGLAAESPPPCEMGPAFIIQTSAAFCSSFNMPSLILEGLRERVDNDGQSRSVHHPQFIAVMHLVQNTANFRWQYCAQNTGCLLLKVKMNTLSMESFSINTFKVRNRCS